MADITLADTYELMKELEGLPRHQHVSGATKEVIGICTRILHAITFKGEDVYARREQLRQQRNTWDERRNYPGKEWDCFRQYYSDYVEIADRTLALLDRYDGESPSLSTRPLSDSATLNEGVTWAGEKRDWYWSA